jgi:hypothetical protein
MTLNVNRNLALETGFAPGVSLETDARAELAAQFILPGSRVLDLSDAMTLQRLLPNGCTYQGRNSNSIRCDGGAVCNIAGGDFPTQAATQSDIIVMLGTQRIADVESLFTHLRFCKQDVILSGSGERVGGGLFFQPSSLYSRRHQPQCSASHGWSFPIQEHHAPQGAPG